MTSNDRIPPRSPPKTRIPPFDRVIALIQILGGLAGLGTVGPQIYRDSSSIVSLTQGLVLLAAALLFLICIVAGALLWRRRRSGYLLSILVQVGQMPIIYTGALIYHFHMIARLPVTLSASSQAMATTPSYGVGVDLFRSILSLGLYLETGLSGAIIGLNLLPILLIFILEYSRRQRG